MFKIVISYLAACENGVHSGLTVLDFASQEEADKAYDSWCNNNMYKLEICARGGASMNTRITKLY